MTDDQGLLYLLQVTSAAFPSGTYAHSAGFETLLDSALIVDRKSLREWADQWMELSAAPSEGVIVGLAHDAHRLGRFDDLLALDHILSAIKSGKEPLEASSVTGRATLRTVEEAFGTQVQDYAAVVRAGTAAGHAAIVFGVYADVHGVPRETALNAYLFTAYSNLVGVVGRLLPLGQRDVQALLADSRGLVQRCAERAAIMSIDEICSMTPLLEIASMRHERLTTRLCIS
ncbi:urease accessory protein UreF [Mycobacterium sp. 155]|uniref:urease accessory protein UreF n=1 Tax=Mycobacterium sp. 155 TaxID=1157943 RepID=UPI00036CB0EA|nr:urease accessory UreF family protein [Mycobacterium sp. 155]